MTDKIFGHDWEDIFRAQGGGPLGKPVVFTDRPSPTALDYHLLEKHGSIEALREAGLCGVADRLESEHNDRA